MKKLKEKKAKHPGLTAKSKRRFIDRASLVTQRVSIVHSGGLVRSLELGKILLHGESVDEGAWWATIRGV